MTELKQISESYVPSVSRARRGMSKPEGTPSKLFNGRDVVWKRVVVAAEDLKKVAVFGENERIQALLSPESVNDITDTMSEYGPDKAAVGRINKDGEIEVGDGSRRLYGSIVKKTPYPIDITDLTDEEMLHLSLTGNIYRQPSVYEHGQRYLNLQESLQLNDTQLVDYLADRGEKVSRRKLSRYIKTAKLPLEVIQAFKIANDCSAEFGEALWRVWDIQDNNGDNTMECRAINIRVNSNLSDPKDIFKALLGDTTKPAATKPAAETLHKLAIVRPMKNGGLAIELDKDIPDHVLAEIKQFIELTLA